jgi:two-component system cell cycle sensor histidine kinase/response regulator CckA
MRRSAAGRGEPETVDERSAAPRADRALRVVHVEDDANDAELVHEALLAEGLVCEVEVVATRQTFTAALERGDVDLVLSDFSLPSFDGFTALAITRDRAPDLPFIVVSGTMGEEAAIESLQRGATDYVLKHRLARLAPAARRALEEAAERRRRRHAEQSLQSERGFLKAILESLETGVVACDGDGLLTLFNRASRDLHGLPEELLPPERWAEHYGLFQSDGKTPLGRESIPLHRALHGERVRNAEIVIVPRRGTARTVLAGGQPITDAEGRRLGAVVVLHDITERKLLETQLRQAQKMEAIGRLAGGVAHDFNNLLNVILGYGEMLLEKLPEGDPSRHKLVEIRSAANRAAGLTRQLLAFSRKQVIEPRVIDLNSLIADMEKMMRRLIGEDIELLTRPAPGLGRVRADPGQIEQILMNLAVNARDAMPDGGRLILETANADLEESFARQHPGARPGRFVTFVVTDTGVGMDAEVQSHLFEPFFTTKDQGKGTGLGLATVYGIVKQSEGYITVRSEPGRGATFTIYLPRVDAPSDRAPTRAPAVSAGGTETLLVVEDESTVRDLLGEILQGLGYTVLSTGDVDEALAIVRDRREPIHLLITDVVMPKMNGRELARRITALRADLKVIYMSGYADSAIIHQGILESGAAFIQKPFSLTTVAQRIREILDGPAARS